MKHYYVMYMKDTGGVWMHEKLENGGTRYTNLLTDEVSEYNDWPFELAQSPFFVDGVFTKYKGLRFVEGE